MKHRNITLHGISLCLGITLAGAATSQARFTTCGSAHQEDMVKFANLGVWYGSLHAHPNGWGPLSGADKTAIAKGRPYFSWETDQGAGLMVPVTRSDEWQMSTWLTVKNAKTDGTWSMVHGFCTIRENWDTGNPATEAIPVHYLTTDTYGYENAYPGNKTTGWTPYQQHPNFPWGSYNNLNQGMNMDAPAHYWNSVGNPYLGYTVTQVHSLILDMMNHCTKPIRSVTMNTNEGPGFQEGDTAGAAADMVNFGIPVTHWVVENFSGSPCQTARLGNAAGALNKL